MPMSSFEKLKLSKQLQIAVSNAGFAQPTSLQTKIFSRINGGQDLVAVAPEGAGKSTALVLASLNKIRHTEEIAPRVLVLVPNKERGEALIAQFHLLNRNKSLRIYGLFPEESTLDTQVLEITDGVDIIVAQPDRARSVYLKLGLNLNKLQLFIVDDADEIVKSGLQLPVSELGRSTPKAQNLVFSSVYHGKIARMLSYYMEDFPVIEVEELEEKHIKCIDQMRYQVPNFKTKLNLLELLLTDKEVFDKVLVAVNTKFTAETVYNLLGTAETATVNCGGFSEHNVEDAEVFLLDTKKRILIITQEDLKEFNSDKIPFLIFFDLPTETGLYQEKVRWRNENQDDQIALTLLTDLELADLKKIEQDLGLRLQEMELPEDLHVETEIVRKKKEEEEELDSSRGGAFHEKKAKNAKTANIKPSERYKKHK